jgi:alanyl-tRNA synthetase
MGAMMLFGEKYGDVVRVVSVGGDYSREFCGGTHVGNAAQIGPFRLVSEGSASAGVRRIEALTGRAAEAYDNTNTERLKQAAALLGVSPAQVPEAVQKLQAELKAVRHELQQRKREAAGGQAQALTAGAKTVNGVPAVLARVDNIADADALAGLADDVLNRLANGSNGASHGGTVVLGTASDGKVLLVAKASKDVVARGVHAGNLVKAAAQAAGGNGGGRPDFAKAGGRDAAKLPDALAAAEATLAGQLGG